MKNVRGTSNGFLSAHCHEISIKSEAVVEAALRYATMFFNTYFFLKCYRTSLSRSGFLNNLQIFYMPQYSMYEPRSNPKAAGYWIPPIKFASPFELPYCHRNWLPTRRYTFSLLIQYRRLETANYGERSAFLTSVKLSTAPNSPLCAFARILRVLRKN